MTLALLALAAPVAARDRMALGIANPEGGGPALADVQNAVYAHKAQIGKFPKMWSLWSKWGDRGGSANCVTGKGSCKFPKEAVIWLQSKGITPVVWWVPVDPTNWEAGKYERYKRVTWGKHDAYIKQWARDLRDATAVSGKPAVVRYAHESLGTWFPWSVFNFDNTKRAYIKAWRYIWYKFRSVGALKRTRFMWSQVHLKQSVYPGNKFVDIVGPTVLNFGSQRTWKPAKKATDVAAKQARSFSKKPVIFAETASHYRGGNKATWIKNVYNRAYYKYPWVKGIIYLDTDEPHKLLGQPDWRLVKPDNGSALAQYKKLANQPRFRGTIK